MPEAKTPDSHGHMIRPPSGTEMTSPLLHTSGVYAVLKAFARNTFAFLLLFQVHAMPQTLLPGYVTTVPT